MSGLAEWRYGRYEAEEGRETFEASGFAQKYSLFYEKSGTFSRGRAGRYEVGVGAEWASLDGEVGDEDINIDALKLLYRGDVLLAPGGLPFRLRLYSQDLASTSFLEDTNAGLSGVGAILRPVIVSDLYSGQRVRTGATLEIGIRNGSYMGQYRDVLSRFPRLLIDYKEDYVRNLESESPQHYRTRNLAFVSLNKKDNWFHYRYLDYTDFENPGENYVEKVYMLGTVDHTLQRQWINMTNWIKVSVDGSFTTTSRIETDEEPKRRYDLNFFATARRPSWQGSTFSTFRRLREEEELAKTLEIPLFLSGEIDRNTAWRFRFVGSRDRRDIFEVGNQDEDVAFASVRLENGRQRRVIVAPEVSVEGKSGDLGEGYAAKARVEAYSNNRYRPEVQWFGGYTLARFAGTGNTGVDVDYWEQQLTGKVERDFSARLRSGFIQDVTYGTGTVDRTSSRYIVPRGDQDLTLSDAVAVQRKGDLFRSTTTWYGEHRSPLRLDNRVDLTYDFIRNDGETRDQLILSHSVNYRSLSLYFDMRNRLALGDSLAASAVGSTELNVSSGGIVDTSFEHSSSLRYAAGRIWEAALTNEVDWRDGDEGSTTRWLARQTSLYNFYTSNGIARKLADLGEQLQYERFTDIAGDVRSLTTFTLLGNYYPSRVALLAARIRYRRFAPEDFDELAYYLSAGLNFRKFTVALDYGYGTRSAGETTDRRREHRWDVRVRKAF